jgi:nucleoside-diphosphate-sugar epimerase
MKVLIVGGNGFLGAWTARVLVERGHNVRIFDRDPSRNRVHAVVGAAAKDIEWLEGDITNAEAVRGALE